MNILEKQSPKTFVNNFFSLSKTNIAGILMITVGILFLLAAIPMVSITTDIIEDFRQDPEFNQIAEENNLDNEDIRQSYSTCGTTGIAIGIISLLGGLFTVKKKNWKLSLITCVITAGWATLLTFFAVSILTMTAVGLSIISTIIIFNSRDEFIKSR